MPMRDIVNVQRRSEDVTRRDKSGTFDGIGRQQSSKQPPLQGRFRLNKAGGKLRKATKASQTPTRVPLARHKSNMRSPSEMSDVTIKPNRQLSLGRLEPYDDENSPVAVRKWSGGFVKADAQRDSLSDLTNDTARKHVIRPRRTPHGESDQQKRRIFSNSQAAEEQSVDGSEYSSLAQMLEEQGFAETRVITPVATLRKTEVVPPVSPTRPPRPSVQAKSSFSRLWSFWSPQDQPSRTAPADEDEAVEIIARNDEAEASDTTINERLARARSWVAETAASTSMARARTEPMPRLLPVTPRKVSAPSSLPSGSAAVDALQQVSTGKKPKSAAIARPTYLSATSSQSYESFSETAPFPEVEEVAYDDVDDSPKLKRTMEISVLRPQASWSHSLFSLSFVSALSRAPATPPRLPRLRHEKSQPALIRKAVSSSALRPVITTTDVQCPHFLK